MPPILLGEYRNQNERRHYPFEDTATLTDSRGDALPTDFLLDAMLYPLDLGAPTNGQQSVALAAESYGVYMSRIQDTLVYFADTVTDTVHGVGDMAGVAAGASVSVYEDNEYQRQVGVLVLGDGIADIVRGGTRTFTAAATALAPTAFVPMNQQGVRGFLLPDGTLVTGAVTFVGQDGVEITSDIDGTGTHRLRIDVVGAPALSAEDCDEDICPPIQSIRVQRVAGSIFDVAARGDDTIEISGHNITLDEICARLRAQKLPNTSGELPAGVQTGNDPCDPTPPSSPPPPPDTTSSFTLPVADTDKSLYIVAPNEPTGERNLFMVSCILVPPTVVRPPIRRRASYPVLVDDMQRVTRPPVSSGRLSIAVRGIGPALR